MSEDSKFALGNFPQVDNKCSLLNKAHCIRETGELYQGYSKLIWDKYINECLLLWHNFIQKEHISEYNPPVDSKAQTKVGIIYNE